jgi:hypothetical protein
MNLAFILSLPLLQIHITAVFITLAIVVVADIHGLLWVLGKIKTLPKRRMDVLHAAVWIGLAIIITAGALMFSTYSDYLLSLSAFRSKMIFVAVLVINAVFIGKHLHIATQKEFSSIPTQEKKVLIISGLVSTTCWIGAFISAKLLG